MERMPAAARAAELTPRKPLRDNVYFSAWSRMTTTFLICNVFCSQSDLVLDSKMGVERGNTHSSWGTRIEFPGSDGYASWTPRCGGFYTSRTSEQEGGKP